MPMNSEHDTKGHEGVFEKSSLGVALGQRLQCTTHTGDEQRPVFIKVLNPHHGAGQALTSFGVPLFEHEAESVLAFDSTKRRHMKNFIGFEFDAVFWIFKQIAVSLAKGVVDLNQDRQKLSLCIVSIPKAHWLEGVTQNPWETVQPDFPIHP